MSENEFQTMPETTYPPKLQIPTQHRSQADTLKQVNPFPQEDVQKVAKFSFDDEVIADKALRGDIDNIIQRVKELPTSRERSLTITKLQEAVMWLGMDLKRLGTPNPYPNSKNPTNTIIEPTADNLKL